MSMLSLSRPIFCVNITKVLNKRNVASNLVSTVRKRIGCLFFVFARMLYSRIMSSLTVNANTICCNNEFLVFWGLCRGHYFIILNFFLSFFMAACSININSCSSLYVHYAV
jgi:hypothetical protein